MIFLPSGCSFFISKSSEPVARKIIVENRPKLVIAVACQRDLVSGIQEVFPIPTYGILNERPFGPCFNTTVDYKKIEYAIKNLIY